MSLTTLQEEVPNQEGQQDNPSQTAEELNTPEQGSTLTFFFRSTRAPKLKNVGAQKKKRGHNRFLLRTFISVQKLHKPTAPTY